MALSLQIRPLRLGDALPGFGSCQIGLGGPIYGSSGAEAPVPGSLSGGLIVGLGQEGTIVASVRMLVLLGSTVAPN